MSSDASMASRCVVAAPPSTTTKSAREAHAPYLADARVPSPVRCSKRVLHSHAVNSMAMTWRTLPLKCGLPHTSKEHAL